jgi:hypothetical protein
VVEARQSQQSQIGGIEERVSREVQAAIRDSEDIILDQIDELRSDF